MTDVVTVAQRQDVSPVAPQQGETAAVLSMIERAARDPSIDISKIEKLMEMRERIERQQAERAFNTAMKEAQSEMKTVGTNKANDQTRSRYATYDKLDMHLRPIYTRHGFSLSFDEQDSPKSDHIRIICYVAHEGGFTRTYRKDMPADGKGAKGGDVMTKTHASGAAASYGMRYLLKGIFNVAIGEEDRDGNAPREVATITPEQAGQLREIVDSLDGDTTAFCRHFRVETIGDLPAKRFDEAMKAVKSRMNARGGK
jgi:hypothetical protein